MLILTNKLKDEIRKNSLEAVPKEYCALLIKKNNDIILYTCDNISHNPTKHCILNPLSYIHAADEGKIVGYVHSHESKFTSILDNFNAFSHNLFSVVYSWKFNIFYLIEPNLKNYLNLPFEIGVNDCFTLIRNYYKNELDIKINDYNRDGDWYKKNPNIILENFMKEGGVQIELDDIKENDVIMFGIENIPSHMGIFINGGYFLHHARGVVSIIEELNNKWKDRIILILRHKNFI